MVDVIKQTPLMKFSDLMRYRLSGKSDRESIWKFNDEEWKVHITSEQLKEEVRKNLILENPQLLIMRMEHSRRNFMGYYSSQQSNQ